MLFWLRRSDMALAPIAAGKHMMKPLLRMFPSPGQWHRCSARRHADLCPLLCRSEGLETGPSCGEWQLLTLTRYTL